MPQLIYSKTVDKSLLCDGFSIKSCYVAALSDVVGRIEVGDTRPLKLLLNGKVYEQGIKLINQRFDRVKFRGHTDVVQVRYSANGEFSKALRAAYADVWSYVEAELSLQKIARQQGEKRRNIKLPADLQYQIAFYATDLPDVWTVETFGAEDTRELKSSLLELPEIDYEQYDPTAAIHVSQRGAKLRILDKRIGDNLKRLYNHRCQVCGMDSWRMYGERSIIEAHHIRPFTQSLNNNYDNIMIMCPNHHRIIHANNGEYKARTHSIHYPNGYVESLKLNLHL